MSWECVCGKINDAATTFCDCGVTQYRAAEELRKSKLTKTETSPNESARPIAHRFKTLLAYGKVLSIVGWMTIAVGILFLGMTFAGVPQQSEYLLYLFTGISGLLFGFPFVVSGQAVSCFVQIEHNTSEACEILKEKK